MKNALKLFFDDLASRWDEIYDPPKLERIHLIFEKYFNDIQSPVLDLGCGTGILLPELNNLLGKGSNIYATDISYEMLKTAKNSNDRNNVKFSQADGHYLPVKNNIFKTVICFQVFPHFHNRNKIVKELFRVIKPQGSLIILHLMGHKELNEMHEKAGHAVRKDRIIAATLLAEKLEEENFLITKILENKDIYLIKALKKLSF